VQQDERLSYGTYLQVDRLLDLQQPLSSPPHHDEMLFIIIHQVYELWFKQLLHETGAVIREIEAGELLAAGRHFRRIHTIQRLLEQQIDVLETMTPQEFNAFRDHLNPASGFQSIQFRELEFLCGVRRAETLEHIRTSPEHFARLHRRLGEPSLYDRVKTLMRSRGFQTEPHDALIAALAAIYEKPQQNYDLYMLMEDLIEFDERFLLWRGRHIRMVERMIGAKRGTGGSLGAAYLATTLEHRFFPELWEVRTHLGKGYGDA
jgi:tryptophan 2,3-dioxygenase